MGRDDSSLKTYHFRDILSPAHRPHFDLSRCVPHINIICLVTKSAMIVNIKTNKSSSQSLLFPRCIPRIHHLILSPMTTVEFLVYQEVDGDHVGGDHVGGDHVDEQMLQFGVGREMLIRKLMTQIITRFCCN